MLGAGCKNMVEMAPPLEDVLQACPSLIIQVTSHDVLCLRAEQQFLAAPFPLSERSPRGKVEDLVHQQAVALFLKHAQAHADLAGCHTESLCKGSYAGAVLALGTWWLENEMPIITKDLWCQEAQDAAQWPGTEDCIQPCLPFQDTQPRPLHGCSQG